MTEHRSFSGTHAFKPGCVSDAAKLAAVTDFGYSPDDDGVTKIGAHWAAKVSDSLDKGMCPRCRGKMPEPPQYPAGSRVTSCRCIPVCNLCGQDEAFYPMPIWRWPTSRSAMTKRRNKLDGKRELGFLAGDRIITESGSREFTLREHPGGWAEFGHDPE